ncbi:MAG: hypothetical protein AAF985_16605 [Bacteroidota bacterium]
MRIIGHIEHPVLKITVFRMNERLSIKFESGLYEQTYKLRNVDEIDTLEDIRKLVDDIFLEKVMSGLRTMHQTSQAALSRMLPDEEDEFDTII